MIEKPKDIESYYKKQDVAEEYIDERFKNSLNWVEHKRQAFFLNSIIKRYKPKLILELAPGPARLTAELVPCKGIGIDSSSNMVKIARKRTKNKNWQFKVGNAFCLEYKHKFDMVFAFRFFLHFKKNERKKLYKQVHNALKNKGIVVFEVMNIKKIKLIRELVGQKKYFVYDELYTKEQFTKEMNDNGFDVLEMHPVLNHFWTQAFISKIFSILKLNNLAKKIILFFEYKSKNPYEWVALCQKK